MTWHPEEIGDAVRRELARFGAAGVIGEIAAAWPEAVGPAIAANAWPARCARDGTLHVAASSSAWAFELTQLEEKIRERLAELLGERAPPRVRFAVGRLPERGGEDVKTSARSVPQVTADALARGERLAAAIDDPELRALVARAAAASLAKGGSEEPPRGPGRGDSSRPF